jgi:hypothetical protein
MSDIPSLSRPAFFDGQSLAAVDLTAVQAYHRDLLWLHQRTLHSWGIASGFAVSGAKGDKSVSIQPGYAVDSQGRSIVLDSARSLDVPSVVSGSTGLAVTYYLTVSYVEDADLPAATVRAGACGSDGAVRRPDEPLLRWQDHVDSQGGTDIVLGAISVLNCKLTGPVDVTRRRSATPETQPYIYAGQTAPGSTKWSPWWLADQNPDSDPPVGLTVSVNTSEAGFANTPKYSAQVVGNRVLSTAGRANAVLDGYVQVGAASASGFVITMALPHGGDGPTNPDWALAADQLKSAPGKLDWYVSWVGVED